MRLQGKRVAVFVEQEFEDLEYWVPVMRLQEEGADVTTIGTGSSDSYRGKHGLTAEPDVTIDRVNPNEFDGVVVPGGWCPDKLRRYTAVLDFVREMHRTGKIVAAICHGGWVLASAGIIQGCRATGSRGIKDDLIHAGATWVDESAFRDGNLVWGRVVEDIPNFCRELVNALAGG